MTSSFHNAPLAQTIKDLSNNNASLPAFAMNDKIFENAFLKYHSKQTFKDFMDIIHRNKTIQLPPFLLDKKAKLNSVSVTYPDYGFDLSTLMKNKRIKNLDKNSYAYRIGLRENDVVLQHEIPYLDKESHATLVLDKKGEPTVFKIPIHKIIYRTVPQYTLI